MVAIAPFAALRYDAQRIPNLSDVLSPPYDVIGAQEQERLYEASPYNVVRLILGKQYSNDTPQEHWYRRAQRDFQAWCDNRILARDPSPALYLIEQAFDDHGQARSRLGFLAALQLDEAVMRVVLRHEATLVAPKEDRTRLLEAIPANLEPIFCVYPDAGRNIQHVLEDYRSRVRPAVSAVFQGGPLRLWPITEAGTIDAIAKRLAPSTVLIADGHHRFEVACANRSKHGTLMTYFVSMEDPALLLQPIHRVIAGQVPMDPQTLRTLCRLEPASSLEDVLGWLERDTGQGRFGYYDGAALYRVVVQETALARWLMTPSVPQPLAALDVSILHGLLCPQAGLNATEVRYTADPIRAMDEVKGGQGRAAWLLRAIPLTQVYALAAQGLRLPPKSTYFYPKVPSGLAINLF